MADPDITLQRIKEAVSRIAEHPKNVTIDEIEWVAGQLEKLENIHKVSTRDTRHGRLFTIHTAESPHSFGVCTHHPGSKQVKSVYVKDFLDVMIELGLYEE